MAHLQNMTSLREAKYYLDQAGFAYRVNSSRANLKYVFCAMRNLRNCDARGKVEMINNEPVGWVIRTNEVEHEHEPPDRELIKFLRDLCHRAEMEPVSLKQIYDEESGRVSADLASDYPFVNVRRLMSGHRQRMQPSIPRTIPEMCTRIADFRPEWGRILENNPGVDRAFLVAHTEDAAVFISPRTSELFGGGEDQNIIYTADGTFKVTPNVPKIYQLYTIGAVKIYQINGVEHKAFIPIVFAMLTKKTEQTYRWLLLKIRELHQQWRPKAVMLNFEVAAMNAFEAVFKGDGPGQRPDFRVTGCWFHFSQSIQRKVQTLRLIVAVREDEDLKRIIKKFMAMALLPPMYMNEGLDHLIEELQIGNFNDIPGIPEFQQYFINYWMQQITPQKFSVFESVIRTNNNHEAFHGNVFLHCADGRRVTSPNIWRFIYALRMMEHAAAIIHKAVQKNKKVSHPRKRKWVAQDNQIKDAYERLYLNPGNLTPKEKVIQFLNRAQHFFNYQLDGEDDMEVEPEGAQVQIENAMHQAEEALDQEEDEDAIVHIEEQVIEIEEEGEDAIVDIEEQVIEIDDYF